MHELLNAIGQQLMRHLVGAEGTILAVFISFIFAWPEEVPKCLQRFIDPSIWTWMRDTAQGAIPLKFVKQGSHPVNPTLPQPKE